MAKEVDIALELYRVANAKKDESNNLREDAGRYAWPTSQDMYKSEQSSEGREYALDVYDSTAIRASFRLAANIMAWLMPVGSKWFEFEAADYEENINDEIRLWLSKATGVTHSEIWRSNFMREMFAAIRSMVVFGTGILSVEKTDSGLVYRAYHIGDIAFSDNSKGQIDTVFRDIYYTARQAVQEFGEDNLPKSVAQKASNPSEASDKIKFIHCIIPNTDFDSKKIDSKKFKSLFIHPEDRMIVKEEQFDSNPYFVMRFTIAPGELFGRSPVTESLPDIRVLNNMALDFMEAAELANHPPMLVEDDSVLGQPATGPRDTIYMRAGAKTPEPWNTGGNLV